MRALVTLLATGLALSSAAAAAITNTSQEKPIADQKGAPTTPSPSAKYCISQNADEATGTRIYSRECRTKSEWARRGVDIDEMQKQQ
ncbi:MAG TPA: hypothetical protein VF098_01920 [Sphingomicrobium sp.]|jgi:hypothetical protein